MNTWSKDMTMRTEFMGRVEEAFQRKKKNIGLFTVLSNT